MPKLVIVIEDGLLAEVVADAPLPDGWRFFKADYDSDNADETCFGGEYTEDITVDPEEVAGVLSDLAKGPDNAMPFCTGGCGAEIPDIIPDTWVPCSGCGGAFCPTCGEEHKQTECYQEEK